MWRVFFVGWGFGDVVCLVYIGVVFLCFFVGVSVGFGEGVCKGVFGRRELD